MEKSSTARDELKSHAVRYVDILDKDYDLSTLDKVLTVSLTERNKKLSSPLDDFEVIEVYGEARQYFIAKWKPNKSVLENESTKLVFQKSSDIISRPIDWLWHGKIAKGKVTLIAGDPGLGKSQVTIFLASVVSNGSLFPGDSPCKKGSVLFFSAEDDPSDTINPRLEAVGADKSRIHIFHSAVIKGKEKSFSLGSDLELLESSLSSLPDVSLIIIDPITAFLGENIDSHKNSDVRALLSSLARIASTHSIAVLVVTHLNKGSNSSAMSKITGSLAFIAAARAGYMVVKDENDPDRRLFLPVKNNLASDKGGFAFKVEGCELQNPRGPSAEPILTSKVVWESEPVTMSIAQALDNDREGSADKENVAWLETYLRNHPGGVSFDILQRDAARNGISKRSLYRAEKNVFVDKIHQGNNKPKIWQIIFDEGNENETT